MPKMKTRKAVKAKFKVTGTGKLLQNHPGRRHKLAKKSSNRKRRLLKQSLVNKAQTKMYSRLMGVA
ncbi:MAG: 50S ribosomal protein L35 [Chlamydiae bacterium]|jgi:large subunit ribosomal protein L35|nr:50S ribosomal protein L35 [Chlamydiota bacterium]